MFPKKTKNLEQKIGEKEGREFKAKKESITIISPTNKRHGCITDLTKARQVEI